MSSFMNTSNSRPTSHAIDIDGNIAEVDRRELETYALRNRLIERAKQRKRREVNQQPPPDPVQPPPDPEQQPLDPEQQPPEPVQQPLDPEQQPPEPVHQPLDPEQQPPEPEVQPPEPEVQLPEPEVQPPEPEVQPPEPEQIGGQAVVNGQQPRDLTDEEVAELKKFEDSKEQQRLQNRVQSITVNIKTHIPGDLEEKTEQIELTKLPHSYKLIRNLLWIEKNPVYRKALAEWEAQENIFASRVGRKLKRSGDFKNEIYSVLGYYSVFQGVLLTASSQSTYLKCQNLGLPVALSAFASAGTLWHIGRKSWAINGLEKTISKEHISLKEVKKRLQALKEKGEAFRFYDFLEDDSEKKSNSLRGFKSIFKSSIPLIVWLAILLFSLVFILAHPLILCRPG